MVKVREVRVVRGDDSYGYSVGAVVEALQSAGVFTEDAMALARDFERRLRHGGQREIPLSELMEILAAGVEKRSSPEAAQRFLRQTPPFVPILVGAGTDQFSRRRLLSSLEKIGLGFKEAHVVAMQVEQGLRSDGLERLELSELVRRIALTLEGRHGRDLRLRFEAITTTSFEIRVRDREGLALPYSRGILAQSLMAVGVSPDLSHNIAKRVETALYTMDAPVVEREVVREQVARLLEREAGDEFARRYHMMREARRRDKPLILLFGGAPGVGKSALASEVGYRLGITRIVSTDSVRQALRSLISPELSPVLHASTYEAWRSELMPSESRTAQPERLRVLRGYLAQVNQLNPAVTAIVERNIMEATSMVMEGVQLLPGTAPAREFHDATVIHIVLMVEDEDDHLRHFAAREGQTGSRRAQRHYIDHFTEIRMLQSYICEEARAADVLVTEARDFDRAVERCVDHVLDVLMKEQLKSESELLALSLEEPPQ